MTGSLPVPCLSLITDRRVCGGMERLEWAVEAAVAGGVQLVQLREKDLAGGPLLGLAERLRRLTEGRALLFVNERVDVALACGADGVHLGEEALAVAEARRLAAERLLLIGRSVHDLAGARQAKDAGADFIQAGPVYTTASHPGAAAASVGLLFAISSSVELPLLGVGGITAENASAVLGAGAVGVAVIRSILAASSPYRAAQQLREAVDHAHSHRDRPSMEPGVVRGR